MINIDATLRNADWPKRTPDRFADLVQKYDPQQVRDAHGRWADELTPEQEAEDREIAARKEKARQERIAASPGLYIPGTSSAKMKQEPLPTTLAAAEDRIREEPNEHAFLLKDGKPFKYMGNNDDHHIMMGDATDADLRDAVLTHNHPSGYGLSNQDGVSAAKRNMLEMRAVTKDGTHSIRRTGTEWPAGFADTLESTHFDLMTELGHRLHAGEITVAEANTLHHQLIYQRLQQQLGGFVHTFEPRHG